MRKSTNPKTVKMTLKDLKKISNNTKLIKKSNILVGNEAKYYNCWGFTAFTFKWIPSPRWFEWEEMEYCLSEFTEPVKIPQCGDIFVIRTWDGDLIHTGILMNQRSKKVIHKPGGCDLEVNSLLGARKTYGLSNKVTYRRALPSKRFSNNKFKASNFY